MDSLLIDDVLTVILQLLDDLSLCRLLQVSKKFSSLATELFWQQRSSQLGVLLRYRKLFSTWRQFYSSCREAVYVVDSSNSTTLHSSIQRAYQKFLEDISSDGDVDLLSLPIEKALKISEHEIWGDARIYLLFPDQEVQQLVDDERLLLEVSENYGRPKVGISNHLAEMPTLGRGHFFFYTKELEITKESLSELAIGISRLTPEAAERLRNDSDSLEVMKVDDASFWRRFHLKKDDPLVGEPNFEYLVSSEFPAIVIDRIQGELKMAVVPMTRQMIRQIDGLYGKRWIAFDETICPIRYRRFYEGLTWESIDQLKKYPVLFM